MANRTLDLRIPHGLSREEARRRIQAHLTELESAKGVASIGQVHHQWTGDDATFRLTTLGQQATGRARVTDTAVELSIDLPWMLAALADKLRPQIEQEARKALEHKP